MSSVDSHLLLRRELLIMSISRRRFAQTAGLAIAGTSLTVSPVKLFAQSLGSATGLSAEAGADVLINMTSEAFLPYVGTIFQPVNGTQRISLQLTEITTNPFKENRLRGVTGESFSLVFRSLDRKALPPGIHTFEHPSLGTFSLFISPIGRSGSRFQAVINHLSLN